MSEELAALPDYFKVFVSSEMSSKALQVEREVTAEAIEGPELGVDWYRAWYWERNAAAGPYSSQSKCIAEAKTADALIMIVADKITPVTLMEYSATKSSGAPCFIMLKDGVT